MDSWVHGKVIIGFVEDLKVLEPLSDRVVPIGNVDQESHIMLESGVGGPFHDFPAKVGPSPNDFPVLFPFDVRAQSVMQENGGLALLEDLEPFPIVGLMILMHIVEDGYVVSSRVFQRQLLLRAVSKAGVSPGSSIHCIKHPEKGSFLEIMASSNDEKTE